MVKVSWFDFYVNKNKSTKEEFDKIYYPELKKHKDVINRKLQLRNKYHTKMKFYLFTSKKNEYYNLIGTYPELFRKHIESKFKNGMTWDNYGSWHIDHIKAVYYFNLENEEEVNQCFNYLNLQPLDAIDNLKKGIK